jgi:hypothetical protein
MSTPDSSPHSHDDMLAARHAARFDACWPKVGVDSVEVVPGPSGWRARAVVQLGGLVPADVRVELLSPEPGAPSSARVDEPRMTCNHSLGNGAFVFDITLPAQAQVRRQEWMIHVHPAEALDEPRVERHFSTGTPPESTVRGDAPG